MVVRRRYGLTRRPYRRRYKMRYRRRRGSYRRYPGRYRRRMLRNTYPVTYKRRSRMITSRGPRFSNLIPRPMFGTRRIIKLKYFDTKAVAVSLSTDFQQVWRANSLQDPDVTGIGHQPMFHDDLSLYYKHYCVLKTEIYMKYLRKDTTNNGGTLFITYSQDSTPPTAANKRDLVEQNLVKCVQLNPYYQPITKHSGWVNGHAMYGLNRMPNFTLFGNNASQEIYIHTGLWKDNFSYTAEADLEYTIYYTVMVSSINEVTGS